MDWVLIRSIWAAWKSFVMVFERYWVDIQQSDRKRYLWRSLGDQLNMWKEEYGITENIILEDFQKEALWYQLELMKDVLVPDPHTIKLIDDAKAKGIKIAVATSSERNRAIKMLWLVWVYDKLDAFVSCEDVIKSKPEPDIFLKASDLLGVEAGNCIVIEDALNGIQAAKSAWMRAAWKLGPHHTKEEFDIAEMVFSDFWEIDIGSLEGFLIKKSWPCIRNLFS